MRTLQAAAALLFIGAVSGQERFLQDDDSAANEMTTQSEDERPWKLCENSDCINEGQGDPIMTEDPSEVDKLCADGTTNCFDPDSDTVEQLCPDGDDGTFKCRRPSSVAE